MTKQIPNPNDESTACEQRAPFGHSIYQYLWESSQARDVFADAPGPGRSASKPGFQTCCAADCQVGSAVEFGWPADLEIRDTAGLETRATDACRPSNGLHRKEFQMSFNQIQLLCSE
jgi:hypothetical protein